MNREQKLRAKKLHQRKLGTKRLQKLAEESKEWGMFWQPTPQYAEQVYNAINRTVFKGTLTRPKILIKNYKKNWWGECEGTVVDGKNVCRFIRMQKFMPNSKTFIRVMAHEMVHQWEWEKGPYGVMTHGKRTFYSWKPECARWGINLT